MALTAEREVDPRHCIIAYERLVEDPQRTLSRVCTFLGLEFDDQMLEHIRVAPAVISWRVELAHMQGALQPLRRATALKRERTTLPLDLAKSLRERLIGGGTSRRSFRRASLLGSGCDAKLPARAGC
jgi:hypothetical protein